MITTKNLHRLHEELDKLKEHEGKNPLITLVAYGDVAAMLDRVYLEH